MPRVDRSRCPVGCLAPPNSLGLCIVHGTGSNLITQVSPEYQARRASTVKLIEAYVDEGCLIQVFEYVDGPKKGERTKLVSKLLP